MLTTEDGLSLKYVFKKILLHQKYLSERLTDQRVRPALQRQSRARAKSFFFYYLWGSSQRLHLLGFLFCLLHTYLLGSQKSPKQKKLCSFPTQYFIYFLIDLTININPLTFNMSMLTDSMGFFLTLPQQDLDLQLK